jgi:hypothetical protein
MRLLPSHCLRRLRSLLPLCVLSLCLPSPHASANVPCEGPLPIFVVLQNPALASQSATAKAKDRKPEPDSDSTLLIWQDGHWSTPHAPSEESAQAASPNPASPEETLVRELQAKCMLLRAAILRVPFPVSELSKPWGARALEERPAYQAVRAALQNALHSIESMGGTPSVRAILVHHVDRPGPSASLTQIVNHHRNLGAVVQKVRSDFAASETPVMLSFSTEKPAKRSTIPASFQSPEASASPVPPSDSIPNASWFEFPTSQRESGSLVPPSSEEIPKNLSEIFLELEQHQASSHARAAAAQ